ncbi:MAG: TCP-1/cpn60 chaperonin family protein [Candidatus Eremiobacteraeota bacterium]|nr:TCP-1/cpn60 chaperonin family protein [Candidatus Eremiobacteraeota bacterium]
MSGIPHHNDKSDIDERLSALLTNAAAVRAIAGAVENTLGPKGLDTMLVDGNGDIIVTNAGVTILGRMEVSHPAARMLINIARNQHEQVGDGTTTATIMAGTLVSEGLNYIIRGVPVSKIIEGIRIGIHECLELLDKGAITIKDMDDPLLGQVTTVAGRNDSAIAGGVVALARNIGSEKLLDSTFRLSERIVAEVGASHEVFPGLLFKKKRLNEQMPHKVTAAKVLALEDSLLPEELSEAALRTEAGFAAYLNYQEEFRKNIRRLPGLGIKLVVLEKGIDDFAEELLTREGILVISRLRSSDFRNVLEYTGAKALKRTCIGRSDEELRASLGQAKEVMEDGRLGHMRISGGEGKKTATFLVGATTEEVVGERERIAQDAASSLQAALKGGVVAGGGAFELSLIPPVRKARTKARGIAAYGIDCVVESLKRPMAQIIANAGFNSLEKIEEALKSLEETGRTPGVDCDSGNLIDMVEAGIIDPVPVKRQVFLAAMEVAEAILRINTIIKMSGTGMA